MQATHATGAIATVAIQPPANGLAAAVEPVPPETPSQTRVVSLLRRALASVAELPCRCATMPNLHCPQCHRPLATVVQDGAALSPEEFDCGKAGDYYCEHCRSDEANSGFRYWWLRELPAIPVTCRRCEAYSLLGQLLLEIVKLDSAREHETQYWREQARTAYDALQDADAVIQLGLQFSKVVGAMRWSSRETNTAQYLERLRTIGVEFQDRCLDSTAAKVLALRDPSPSDRPYKLDATGKFVKVSK